MVAAAAAVAAARQLSDGSSLILRYYGEADSDGCGNERAGGSVTLWLVAAVAKAAAAAVAVEAAAR